jgi:hypothetical protein
LLGLRLANKDHVYFFSSHKKSVFLLAKKREKEYRATIHASARGLQIYIRAAADPAVGDGGVGGGGSSPPTTLDPMVIPSNFL